MSKESKAKEYAQNVACSLLENALEAAYLEGFNAGVESVEHPVTQIIENGVTYVDLGLPSGTMWAVLLWANMRRAGFRACYHEALEKNIPNKEQVEELIKNTRCLVGNTRIKIVGRNGRSLCWDMHGIDEVENKNLVSFWIRGEESSKDHTAEYLRVSNDGEMYISKEFTGYHMYLALVKNKE